MEIKTERVCIDDKHGKLDFDVYTYVSNDGKEFRFEKDCLWHEKKIEIKEKISHIPTKEGKGLGFEKWYYVTSYSDIQALAECVDLFNEKELSIDTYHLRNIKNEWISFIIDEEETHGEYGSDDGKSWFNCTFYSFNQVEEKLLQRMKEYAELKKIFED